MESQLKRSKLVMVGNGMAGVRTIEELLKVAPELYDIAVFGAEPHPNYNRILLSPVLAGEQTLDEIVLNSWDWYAGTWRSRCTPARKWWRSTACAASCVRTDGTEEAYDRLLLCTGSNPFILPVPGNGLQGVIAYRDIADTNTMIEAARQVQEGGRHRRRPAGPGSRERADAARHERHRGARDAVADGTPARRRGRQAAAEIAGGTGPDIPARCADRGTDRRRGWPREVDPVQGRHAAGHRPRGHGRRHPAQHRARRKDETALSTAASWCTTPCRP